MKALKNSLVFFGLIGLFLLGAGSCVLKKSPEYLAVHLTNSQLASNPGEELPFEEDPREIDTCKHRKGQGCWEFSTCRTFCEDVFFSKELEETCYNWAFSLYEDFAILFNLMDKKAFQEVEPEILSCFIRLSGNQKDTFLRSWDQEKAEAFLEELAFNEKLAYELFKVDKKEDFEILEALFRKLGHRKADRNLKVNLDNLNESFFTLIQNENNYPAWKWLDNYVSMECKKDRSCEEPLEYYCEVLEDYSRGELDDFLYKNDLFAKDYRGDIESKTCRGSACEYGDVQDLRTICRDF